MKYLKGVSNHDNINRNRNYKTLFLWKDFFANSKHKGSACLRARFFPYNDSFLDATEEKAFRNTYDYFHRMSFTCFLRTYKIVFQQNSAYNKYIYREIFFSLYIICDKPEKENFCFIVTKKSFFWKLFFIL